MAELKQKDLEIQLQNKEKELQAEIDSLISEVKRTTEEKLNLENTLATFKKEMEIERDAVKEREEKSERDIKKLQDSVRVSPF